jgi:hypothetical protein
MSSYMVHPAQVTAIISCTIALASKAEFCGFRLPQSILPGYGDVMGEVRYPSQAMLDALGKLLLQANANGQMEKYRDDESAVVAAYQFKTDDHAARQDVGFLASLIRNLDYQACEWSGWRESEARKWLDWATDAGLRAMPSYKAAGWGYDGAPAKAA